MTIKCCKTTWIRNKRLICPYQICIVPMLIMLGTVYPKKYAHGFCFAVLCCGYTLTDFPISMRLTSLALWQSNDCPSASKATLMNMDKYFMWIHYERLHNHNKAKHNKTMCIFLGIYCKCAWCVEHNQDSIPALLQGTRASTSDCHLMIEVHIKHMWCSLPGAVLCQNELEMK